MPNFGALRRDDIRYCVLSDDTKRRSRAILRTTPRKLVIGQILVRFSDAGKLLLSTISHILSRYHLTSLCPATSSLKRSNILTRQAMSES